MTTPAPEPTDAPRVVAMTAAEVRHEVVALRAAEHTWQELIEQYGSLDLLRDQIDSYGWLLSDETTAPGRKCYCNRPPAAGESHSPTCVYESTPGRESA